jgi:GH24 family phage-related lysozyme (muramidase)
MPNSDLNQRVFSLLSQYEGFRAKPYRDSKKLWTVGYGTLIGDGSDEALRNSPYRDKALDEAEAAKIASEDIAKKTDLIRGLVGPDAFDKFSPELRAHLVSGAYRGDITGSPKTIQLLKAGDFESASKEFLDNEEYRKAAKGSRGVVKRMNDMAAVVANEKPVDFASAVERAIATAEKPVQGEPASPTRAQLIGRDAELVRSGEPILVKPRRTPQPNE